MAAPVVQPTPSETGRIVDQEGRPTPGFYRWMQSLRAAATIISDPDLFDTKLNLAGGEMTGGVTHTEYDNGTPTNGANITIDPSNGLKQKITNNVAGFTITATAEIGDVELRIINGASAGTITWSGFHRNFPGGDLLTTTNGHQFLALIYGFGAAGADYIVRSRQ